MQGEKIQKKQPSPNSSGRTSSLPKETRSTFPAPAGDTILIVTALGFHDLIMTVSAFHKRYIIYVFLTIN